MPAMPEPHLGELSAEDTKLVTLARSARLRTGAAQGAAARDATGRTYAAASVALPALRLSALQAVVAAAVSSGTDHLEAVALVADATTVDDDDRAVLGDVGVQTVILAGPDGTLRR
jgi:hypothetical protein